MAKEPIILTEQIVPPPAPIRRFAAQGERAGRGFIEFFTVAIRNRNTGMTYARGKTIL
jgi:hypothetical protein